MQLKAVVGDRHIRLEPQVNLVSRAVDRAPAGKVAAAVSANQRRRNTLPISHLQRVIAAYAYVFLQMEAQETQLNILRENRNKILCTVVISY